VPVRGSHAHGAASPVRGNDFSAIHESGFAKRYPNETTKLEANITARVEKTILKRIAEFF
jgi:hypothetical protein